MGVLCDSSGWCFCFGGAKLERIKSTILAAKGAAFAAVSFPSGGEGGGKGGGGFLIHRSLLLTTHGTIPSAAAAGAAEVRLKDGRLPARLVPQRFFITSPILDLTIVGLDTMDDDSNPHGQQPQFLKTCLNPSLDLGSTVLLLGHANKRDLAVGEGKVVIATDNLIKFSADEVSWRPGSAGFDMLGNLAFMVCNPMKLAPSTPTGYASASSIALVASKKDMLTQFGIPIPAVCEWLKQHWGGSLEDVSKPTMPPARLQSTRQPSELSSRGIHYNKTMEGDGGDVSSSSQIPPKPTWQHGSCSSASAKISYGENDTINSQSFHKQRDPTSLTNKPKKEQPASVMDISIPPGHPKTICLPLPLKQMMSDENKIKPNCSVSHESRLANVRINCDTLHNVAYQENCWSEVQSSSSPPEISELGDRRDGFSSGEETMYSAETRESRNIPSPKEKRPEIVGKSRSFANHSKWDSPKSVESSKGVPSKSHTFIPLRKPHLQAAAISQKSQVYFSPTVSSNMKRRNLSRVPMKPRQSAQVTSKWTV